MSAYDISSCSPATSSVVGGIRDDEKQKVSDAELGEVDPHLKRVKRFSVRSCPSVWPHVLVMRCFYMFSRRPIAGYDIEDGEAKKQLPFRLECLPKSTAGRFNADQKKPYCGQERHSKLGASDFITDDEAKQKPSRQELGQDPTSNFQTHPLAAPVNRKCHVKYNEVSSTFCYGFRSLFQWSVFLITRCYHCFLCHRFTSASSDDVEDNGTKLDHQEPNQATDDQLLSVISRFSASQNRENHVNDDVSISGDEAVRTDSTEIFVNAVQRTSGDVSLDVVESITFSAEYPVESRVGTEEMIITTLNLGDPGEPAEELGGLSLLGYKRIVFSVCPALPSINTDFE